MPGKIVFESQRFVLASGVRANPRASTNPAQERARRSPLPVVVGCPRSGTSLLAVMLDSHPEVAVPPETSFIGAVAMSRVIRSLLFGVNANDPLIYAIVTVVLIAAAIVACWLPARRASRVNPMITLRAE